MSEVEEIPWKSYEPEFISDGTEPDVIRCLRGVCGAMEEVAAEMMEWDERRSTAADKLMILNMRASALKDRREALTKLLGELVSGPRR